MPADKTLEVAAAGLNSIRAYRSRRARPCDRCRSRKQRCVILAEGAKCLNCELGSSACRFDEPAPPNPSNAARSTRRAQNGLLGSSTGPKGTSTSPVAGPSHTPTPPSQPAAPHPPPPALPSLPARLPPMAYFPPPINLPQRTRLSDLVRHISQASNNTSYYMQMSHPTDDYPALDLQADEEEELYLVGTASERDALRLSMSVVGADSSHSNEPQGLKVRHVSMDPRAPIAFVFMGAKPYAEAPITFSVHEELVKLIGPNHIDRLMQDYLKFDANALPIWSQEHYAANPAINPGLHCSLVTCALVYSPTLRHLQHQAWGVCRAYFRARDPRARLSFIQATLLDLNGRHGVDPAGNFVRLGTTVAVARLLGLHKDCSTWTIPLWERDLRTRLWWALLIYDKASALTFGRASCIVERDISLPRRSPHDSASYDSFVSLCELTLIMDDLNRRLRTAHSQSISSQEAGEHGPNSTLQVLDEVSLKLDRWKSLVDSRRLFDFAPGEAPPGVRSLQLVYEYTALIVAREAWDAVASEGGPVAALGQRACLQAATTFVEFVATLVLADLEGYWASHSPFFISTCLTILVRLALESDRHDRSETAVWQSAVFSLRRLISALSDARREAAWDIADLALSRAHFFLPLLSRQAPEFQVVLQPLVSAMPAPPVDEALEEFLNTFVQDTYAHARFDDLGL